MVKRLRHRPFTAVTGVQIPLESFDEENRQKKMIALRARKLSFRAARKKTEYADVAQFTRNKDCVHNDNIISTNACMEV